MSKIMCMDLDTKEVGPLTQLMYLIGLQGGMKLVKVVETESFQDLVKYGEWMPVEVKDE